MFALELLICLPVMAVWFSKLYGSGKELVKESQSNVKQAKETSTSAPSTAPKERDRIIILGVNAFKAQWDSAERNQIKKRICAGGVFEV